jgi:hypothetical protein
MGTVYARHKLGARPRRVILSADAVAGVVDLSRSCAGGRLKRTLASTNSRESMIETVRRTSRNVKRLQSGGMCLRWTAAGTREAERRFRKIIGHADLAKLAIAVERGLAARRAANHRHDRGAGGRRFTRVR